MIAVHLCRFDEITLETYGQTTPADLLAMDEPREDECVHCGEPLDADDDYAQDCGYCGRSLHTRGAA